MSSPLVARLARLTVVATFGLIVAGGLVTSRDAGLAVPDWPLSFGTLNPPRWLEIVNVRTEHGHRLIAGAVALLTVALACAARARRERVAVLRVCIAAVGLVLVQALLGGLRVLHLSIDLAMVHALTGQLFLCTVVAIATLTSRSWPQASREPSREGERFDAALLFVLVLAQLVLGIVVRHLSNDEKPLLGHVTFQSHAVLAFLIAALATRQRARESAEVRPAAAERAAQVVRLVVIQIGLGLATFFVVDPMAHDRQASGIESWLPTLHVVTGACILAAIARSTLYAYAQPRPASTPLGIAAARAEKPVG